ncbi:hypothetical protein QTL86_21275 [Cellulosilyticum sp. ST5]|nr:hypothetical protein [Cellulosilyticum sp. WCF-2]
MKKNHQVKKNGCFQELSTKEKQKVTGGAMGFAATLLKQLVPYIMP